MNEGSDQKRRALLRQMFDAAVAAAHPARCLPAHLPEVPRTGRLFVVGAGKAGAAMAVAAGEHYLAGASRLPSGEPAARCGANLVEAPGTAPGSEWLITTAFITIAGRIRQHSYSPSGSQKKGSASARRASG